MRKLVTGLVCVAAVATTACKDALNTPDLNQPDIAQSYSSPSTLSGLIATSFAQVHQSLYNSSTALDPQLQVAAFENYATVANFSMSLREEFPRSQIDNSRGNFSFAENYADYQKLAKQARYSANYVQSLDAITKVGGHLSYPTGVVATDTTLLPAQDQLARSFAFFSNGVALGYLAMEYDSASITTPAAPAGSVLPLSSYQDVMAAAITSLDTAVILGSAAKAAAAFPLPPNYLNGSTYTQAQYVALVKSFRARMRAGVARTPAERAAVNWTDVIADATAGIQSDFVVQINGSAGWGLNWLGSQMFQGNSSGWHEMTMMVFGAADTSGAYNAWIQTPISARPYILVETPDKRWPAGATRSAQQASNQTNWDYTKYPYIRNRTGSDPNGEAWGSSYYDFYRFDGIFQNKTTGPWIELAKVENDMLAAEGYIYQQNYAAAAALINVSRTRVGLPPVTGAADGGLSGSECVPRVPTSAGNTTQCGNLLEAMKYEKRMETAYTGYGQWYFDARGWGDLAEGTPLEWPVPYQEMDARGHAFYNLGGVGGPEAAAKGTYGF